MPNNVINEVVFTGITPEQRDEILANVLNIKGNVDFTILLPPPLNCWQGGLDCKTEIKFPINWYSWHKLNWGTKWNAYDTVPVERDENDLRLIFQTAWSPPYGWFAALVNRFRLPFTVYWMSEGDIRTAYFDQFNPKGIDDHRIELWVQTEASCDKRKYLWEVLGYDEIFDDDDVANKDT